MRPAALQSGSHEAGGLYTVHPLTPPDPYLTHSLEAPGDPTLAPEMRYPGFKVCASNGSTCTAYNEEALFDASEALLAVGGCTS
jgi:hypothetical protein